VGTLGKAFGSIGGFVACSSVCRDFLVNRARSFIYATALPPASAAAARAAVERVRQDPCIGRRLLERARWFHGCLEGQGFSLPAWQSQIIPVVVGDNGKAVELARRLGDLGLLVTAVRPPTVPVGTARLRLSVTLSHEPSDLEQAARTMGETAREMGLL
jgi:glycine C-acetyltransferase/8-amino-7-oxononanoate synthase